MSGYTSDNVGSAPEFHNTLAIQNTSTAGPNIAPTQLQWYEPPLYQRGAQWKEGQNAGDPSSTASFGADYVFAGGDVRNLYNRPSNTPDSNFMDVTRATRSTLWLKPDHIVIYDRATTNTAGRFKRFHLQMLNPASIAGKLATSTSPSGQRCYIETLLPAAAAVTTAASFRYPSQPELGAPMWQLNVEDPSKPADVRFLHVVQGANAATTRDVPALVQSSSTPIFEGAAVGANLVLFPWLPLTALTTPLIYTAPAGVTRHYITGLAPHAGHTVSDSGGMITVRPGWYSYTDAAGMLTFDPALSPFDNWRTARFGKGFAALADAAPAADGDRDGLTTLMEYALGTDPLAPGPMPSSAMSNGLLTFTFSRNLAAPDVRLTVETTGELTQPWTPGSTYSLALGDTPHTPTTTEMSCFTTGLLQTITVRCDVPAGRRFLRLFVTMP